MSNEKAVIFYESGQNAQAMEVMTTTDNTVFSATFAPFSAKSGFDVKVMPNGLINGGAITPSASNNDVDVAQALEMLAAVTGADADGQLTVSGTAVTCARPTTDTHLVYSITVDNTGALVAVAGSEGTAFSDVRDAVGGPPLIAVDSIEIGQVRLSSQTAGVVTADEIKQVPNLHQELSDFPVFEIDYATGQATFASAVSTIHTGAVPREVHVSGFTPIFAEVPKGYDWVPAEESYSTNSQQVYGSAVGSTSSSLAAASFSAILKDGITDNILKAVGEKIWVKFKQDRNRAPNQLTQGLLGINRTFPADNNVGGAFTLSPESKSADYSA